MKTDTRDRNLALVKRIGGKDYNPCIPDENRYFLRHGKTALSRTVAWIREHTLAAGHPENPDDPECLRSPYCVDKDGKPVFTEDLANYMGWKPQTARNNLNEAEQEGFCQVDHHERKIWLCGKIPAAYRDREEVGAEGDADADDFEGQLCTKLPPYLREQLLKLEPTLKSATLNRYAGFLDWRSKLLKEGMAQLRDHADEYEDIIWLEAGIEKKREEKRRDPVQGILNLTVPRPNFVQSCQNGNSAQGKTEATNGLYKPQNGSVQPSPPLLSTEHSKNREDSYYAVIGTTQPKAQQQEAPPVPLVKTQAAAATATWENLPEKAPPTYAEFRSLYPQGKLDDARAHTAFTALSPLEKQFCLEGLRAHLLSERWVRSLQENNGFYIPLASNFIKRGEYRADPPPYLAPKTETGKSFVNDVKSVIARNMREKGKPW